MKSRKREITTRRSYSLSAAVLFSTVLTTVPLLQPAAALPSRCTKDASSAALLAPGGTDASLLPCDGDCDGDGKVTIEEVIRAVNIALGNLEVTACQPVDADCNGDCEVNEILRALNNTLSDCGALPTQTPAATPTATPTPSDDNRVLNTDTTIDTPDRYLAGIEVIDGPNPPTLVQIVEGGVVRKPAGDAILARDRSEIVVFAGTVDGGTDDGIDARDASNVAIHGGEVFGGDDDGLEVTGSGVVTIDGGFIFGRDDGVSVEGPAEVNIRGGALSGLSALWIEAGTVNLSGGTLFGSVNGITAPGGTLNITGGRIRGGSRAAIHAGEHAVVNIAGGDLTGRLLVSEFTVVNIIGPEFNLPFGEITLTSGSLVGTLDDGSAIQVPFLKTEPSARIVLCRDWNCEVTPVEERT